MTAFKILDRALTVVMIAAAIIFVLDHYGVISAQAILQDVVGS